MPRVSQDQLDARRSEILGAARSCFARYGYEGATERRLEEATGLSRGAIFHHFRDKESLFLAVAEDDAAAMVETVARNGLVQVMRDLLADPAEARRLGDGARRRARERFSLHRFVQDWDHVLRLVTAHSPPRVRAGPVS